MERYSGNILALVGPPFIGLTPVTGVGLSVEGFAVTVFTYPGLGPVTIYSDNGITVRSNPIPILSDGSFFFYAPTGRYTLKIIKPGVLSKTIDDILISDGRKTVNVGTPAVVNAQSSLQHQVTLSGLAVGDFVSVVKPTHQTGLVVGSSSVIAPNTLAITFVNVGVSGIIPTPGEIYIVNHHPQ